MLELIFIELKARISLKTGSIESDLINNNNK